MVVPLSNEYEYFNISTPLATDGPMVTVAFPLPNITVFVDLIVGGVGGNKTNVDGFVATDPAELPAAFFACKLIV